MLPQWILPASEDRAWRYLRSPQDLTLLARIGLFALWIRAARGMALPRLLARVTPAAPRAADHFRAYQTLVFVKTLVPSPGRVRSLTLYHFLRRAGLDAAVHFGVSGDGGAECSWVTLHGRPILEHGDPCRRCQETVRYSGPVGPARVARGVRMAARVPGSR